MRRIEENSVITLGGGIWALYVSVGIMNVGVSAIAAISGYPGGLTGPGIILFVTIAGWVLEILSETHNKGSVPSPDKRNNKEYIYIFVGTELIIFGTVILAYLYNLLIPSPEIGSIVPVVLDTNNTSYVDPSTIGLFNVIILYLSGLLITAGYERYKSAVPDHIAILLTLILAGSFVCLQYVEYNISKISMSDSVYGTFFFAITGLHGIHVILATAGVAYILYAGGMGHYLSCRRDNDSYAYCVFYYHFVDYLYFIIFGLIYLPLFRPSQTPPNPGGLSRP